MRLTVLRMLSTSSLQAFSGATTTSPLSRPGGTDAVRLVRNQVGEAARTASPSTSAIPETRPSVPPPRGTLLNLSV